MRSYFDISNCSANSLEHELQIGSVDIAFLISESINSSNLKSEVIIKGKTGNSIKPGSPLSLQKTA